jgi:hypothetical protein
MKLTYQLNWYIVESSFQLGGVSLNIPLNILDINNVYKLKCLLHWYIVKNMSWIKGHF